ncbi:hypothetical protein Vadar_018320 [Vaccinium darrowii]|uniref:Uncharacterized protein n=1 Tax=Vaccinium darrowii TaxID=229202 RepID=A0ACB7YN39_9ERIC|nr:hypothetical protein Vadar_018320 [Vaccinium darrowii]
MTLISTRREEASKWVTPLCPEMDKRLGAAFNESKTWAVSESGDGVYEVHSQPNATVHLSRRICSCQKWQLLGFPCSHAVVVISSLGKDHAPYVDPYLYTQTFQNLYSFSVQPIPTEWMPDQHVNEDFLLPPLCKRPPGRPKIRRIPSRGENISLIRCGSPRNVVLIIPSDDTPVFSRSELKQLSPPLSPICSCLADGRLPIRPYFYRLSIGLKQVMPPETFQALSKLRSRSASLKVRTPTF